MDCPVPPSVYLFCILILIVTFTLMGVLVVPQPPITCHNSYKFLNSANFSACSDLPVLDSSIHWNYHSPSNTIDMAFMNNNVGDNQWIAWAINPNSTGMVGSQAFVAFKKSDGTMVAYTSPIATYDTRLEKGNLSFTVHGVSASFEDRTMIIYAKFQLPQNSSLVNQVWQQDIVSHVAPQPHALKGGNINSFGRLDFLEASYYSSEESLKIVFFRRIKVGGILNAIGWGILMPIGIMIARYSKAFEATKSTWFHLHWICMILAYVIGTAGWAVNSIRLLGDNNFSDGSVQLIFCTFQIFLALLYIRPEQNITSSNLCHSIYGYILMLFAMVGGGFFIPKRVYNGIIFSLGCVAVILEFQLYRIRIKKKKQVHPEIIPHGNNQIP